ncbi:DNA polymerase IV [Cellulomonas fengjieae]|uniref:DNA polymerase IV n=1 Tax=Cellulomonas fengjieae TaxID=2819978 RepID=A0ABS3SG89_9CELL|nr:DNA polymerase IV [Cellulomonas fengjieae]MBO3084334.1 DNA polymerase IV [Cellulomonas fengjieae]QVI67317.1 DNA polymerase IV [Cellulomonas fengjieae]
MSRAPRSVAAARDWGHEEVGCSILHVDMDAFFASVELARRPHLRGLPVIVGGTTRAVVLAATYEARAFGVHSAMPMAAALRRCPQAVVVPPDHDAYREVSTGVMRLLNDVTVLVEQVSVDEAFLDVGGARRRLGPPTVIAQAIRRQVRDQFGITCSVGIGSTKLVAKLASGHAKPDGVLLVPRAATLDFLRVLPVGALGGVGEKTEAALARWGIRTVAELADSEPATVQRAVGRVTGAHLVDLAWGRDPRPVVPGREEKSVGAEETFPADVADLAVVQDKARELADRCAVRLRSQGLVGRTIGIKIRTADFRTLTRSRTLVTPTDVGREVFLTARELLAGVDLGGLPVRLVGVRAEGLSPAAVTIRQPTLVEASDDQVQARGDAERAMDRVRERFGRRSIEAGLSQSGGVSSGSTITILPTDLS